MARIITTYIVVLVLVSLGFIGVGAIASATEPQGSAQPANAGNVIIRNAK